ncbi:MAG: hypothetical protein ACKPKO_19375, partial [Candidatus Fonsibacter sp.]
RSTQPYFCSVSVGYPPMRRIPTSSEVTPTIALFKGNHHRITLATYIYHHGQIALYKETHHSITLGLSLTSRSKSPYIKKPIAASGNLKKPFK